MIEFVSTLCIVCKIHFIAANVCDKACLHLLLFTLILVRSVANDRICRYTVYCVQNAKSKNICLFAASWPLLYVLRVCVLNRWLECLA